MRTVKLPLGSSLQPLASSSILSPDSPLSSLFSDTLRMCYALNAGPLNLPCGADNFGVIWSACGQHEILYPEWRMTKYSYNSMYNFSCIFFYTTCAVKLYYYYYYYYYYY
jgi:hypothetical protein